MSPIKLDHMSKDNQQSGHIRLETEDARQGRRVSGMRTVLVVSTLAAVAAMALIVGFAA